jgi:tetratricopeptide (TPR) repeat protein
MKTYNFDDIARYAEGDLPEGERQAFEQALADDASLKQQLDLYREVHSSLKQHFHKDEQDQQLHLTLQNMQKEFFPASSTPAKVVSINRTLRYAIGIAAIFIVTLFLWRPWQPGLFTKYADTQMVNQSERGENTDTLLQQAAIAFNKKEYSTASGLLERILQQKPDDSYAGFYYGVTLLQTNKRDSARSYFTKLFAGESVFKYEAAFYQALTYLDEGNKPTCIEWLQRIPADAGIYAKAEELLRELK